ncbi:hypothetical protein BHE74_00023416, partial [Ensete ventricosum]
CSLGDATSTDAYYEKALEVSNHRSARAKVMTLFAEYSCVFYLIKPNIVRLFSLNSVHWLEMHTTGVTMRSQKLFGKWQGESALALNSLYPDGWFALGAAALKARDTDKALDAFTRAVQIDPDNGEAWNNVACLHMIKKKSKAAFIAFKEALKFRPLAIGWYHQNRPSVIDFSCRWSIEGEINRRWSIEGGKGKKKEEEDTYLLSLRRPHLRVVGARAPSSPAGRPHVVLARRRFFSHSSRRNVFPRGEKDRDDKDRQVSHNLFFELKQLDFVPIIEDIALARDVSIKSFLTCTLQAANFSDTDEFGDLKTCLDEVKKQIAATSGEGA